MNLKIGNTPLIELTKDIRALNGVRIFAKLEGDNAGGSVKSRVALAVLEEAERKGELQKGNVIVEATSGNMGVGLALIAQEKGYSTNIFLPENMQGKKSVLMQKYGAKITLTPANEGMRGAVKRAEEFVKNTPSCFYVNQFRNPVCVEAHYRTTGKEIWVQSMGKVDIFVAGFGTGGTLSGTAKYLKEKKPTLRVVAIEPFLSPLLSKGVAGAHSIQGIGANFIPPILDVGGIDEVFLATDRGAELCVKWLKKNFGLSVGTSSGAAFWACLNLAIRAENKGKNIFTIFPDKAMP